MPELKDQLSALQVELKSYVEKANDEKKNIGTMQTETKSAIEKLQTQLDAIDAKIAQKHVSGSERKSLVDSLKENENVARLMRDKKGHASFELKSNDFEKKTVITSSAVGTAVSGVLGIDRIPGIVAEARQTLRIRDLITARPTTMQLIDFVKVTSPLSPGQIVPETNVKPDNAVGFATQSEAVKTIATTITASKQVLADFTELAGYLDDALPYAVNLDEEEEFLAGDGTQLHLHGFLTQAQQASYTVPNGRTPESKIQQLGLAIQQIAQSKEYPPTFMVLNVADWWSIKLSTNSFGGYILGDPQGQIEPTLFGLVVVPTTTIAQGTYLVGSGAAPCSEIRDREEMTVELSTENTNNFVTNMVTIRAEKRVALIVKRPNAFVTGTFK